MDGKDQTAAAGEVRGEDRIGLVLGGGAALGLAHVGVIRALEEENIRVDVVVGCSMGALVGGLWATGRKAEDLEKIAHEFSKKTGMLRLVDLPLGRGLILLAVSVALLGLGQTVAAALMLVASVFVNALPGAGVIKGQAIAGWLRSKFGKSAFDDARLTLRIVAYDLWQRQEIVIDRGLIADAVFKSIALPGIIPPVTAPGQMIVDGGVLNPLPVNVLTGMGIRKIIAVNVLPPSGQTQSRNSRPLAIAPDVIVRSLQVAQDVLARTSGRQASVLITPDLKGVEWFELDKADQLIRCGYEAARQHLPALKALVRE